MKTCMEFETECTEWVSVSTILLLLLLGFPWGWPQCFYSVFQSLGLDISGIIRFQFQLIFDFFFFFFFLSFAFKSSIYTENWKCHYLLCKVFCLPDLVNVSPGCSNMLAQTWLSLALGKWLNIHVAPSTKTNCVKHKLLHFCKDFCLPN